MELFSEIDPVEKPPLISDAGLQSVAWKRFLRAPDAQLVKELYEPALSRAARYDRCCAYFSSQVLSVAARGFGPFVQTLLSLGDEAPRPAARLLVNEQLEASDLAALQATGDQSKLIEKLLKQFKTPADALAKSRLEMLAWLVAEGLLEVRVGLMRHTKGLNHAKFGIVTDAKGDRIAFMGSDNETGNALVENYEELTLSTSWKDPEFVDYYAERFTELWDNHDPYVTTLALPDALRLKLVKLAPKTPPVAVNDDSTAREVTMLWRFLAAAPYLTSGEAACDATALVELWPHQKCVVEDTARAFPAGRLLCDEVGMGKTIEAILVLRRLLAGRGVQRALLLVPAGLLRQWQDELREKGGLLIPFWESRYLYLPNGEKKQVEAVDALAENPLLLMSREWARLDGNLQTILAAPQYDICLLDEAHAARRSDPDEGAFNQANLLLSLLRELQLRHRTRGLLLLSATPMQTQAWEPWDLLQTLGVGGDWLIEFNDIRSFYAGIGALTKGVAAQAADVKLASRLIGTDGDFPPAPAILTGGQPLEKALTFAIGSKRKQYADWLRAGSPLARRMHRNTRDTLRDYYHRGLLDAPPPSRQVRDEVFDYGAKGEREVYDAVADYINERFDALETQRSGKGFVMTVYRRRAASSPRALRQSLQRRLEGLERVIHKQAQADWLTAADVGINGLDLGDGDGDMRIDPALPTKPGEAAAEAEQVRALLARLDALGMTDSKLDHFFSALNAITADGRAALVFTEYADTMEYLRDRLHPVYGASLGTYSGAGGQVWDGETWQTVTKADITQRLRAGGLRVLVCTDAASEGLNLQAAAALINYDLPWNPSRVEQRIGRIDRIGQKQAELPIRNLFLKDSVDMRVYAMLRMRCGLFEHYVGPMQPVLELARAALQKNLRPQEAAAVLKEMEKTAAAAEADAAVVSAFVPSTADGSTVGAPTGPSPAATRADLETALNLLATLKNGGTMKVKDGSPKAWRVSAMGGPLIVTTDRETLERDAARAIVPLTLGSNVLERIVGRLPALGTRAPLVVAEYAQGAFRAAEVRWVSGTDGTAEEVTTFAQLRALIAAWRGAQPDPKHILDAWNEAAARAKNRVVVMVEAAERAEEDGLLRQIAAARQRLLRELGRTLRCLGDGDLNDLLKQQAGREKLKVGRYRRALELLGGYPQWTAEQYIEVDAIVSRLPQSKRLARLTGTEIDAALADPRWRAMMP